MTDFFKLKERHSNIRTEVLAGVTTFSTMVYILAVNLAVLSRTGMPADAVFSATVLASIIAMLIIGLWANLPLALSAGMGLNAFFAYTVCAAMGYSYQMALTAVFCEGIVFILLSLLKCVKKLFRRFPLF